MVSCKDCAKLYAQDKKRGKLVIGFSALSVFLLLIILIVGIIVLASEESSSSKTVRKNEIELAPPSRKQPLIDPAFDLKV
jgi:hypothetical protein